ENRHDGSPQSRSLDSRYPKCDAGQRALNDADYQRPLDSRSRDRSELGEHSRLILIAQRSIIKNPFKNFVAVSEKEKHGVKHYKQIEEERSCGGSHARRETDQKRAGRFSGGT